MEVEVRKNGKSLELLVSSGSLLYNVTDVYITLAGDNTLEGGFKAAGLQKNGTDETEVTGEGEETEHKEDKI